MVNKIRSVGIYIGRESRKYHKKKRGSGLIRVTFLAVLLHMLIPLTGCGGNLPSYFRNPDQNPEFPPGEFITAVAESDLSARDAEEKARDGIAAKVKAEISSTFRSKREEFIRNGESNFTEEVAQKIEVKSRFKYAELIKTECRFQGSMYYSFAYLSRDKLLHVLSEEYTNESVAFRKAAEITLDSDMALDSFTASYRHARELFAELTAIRMECFALGKSLLVYESDSDIFRNLESKRVGMLRLINLVVEIPKEYRCKIDRAFFLGNLTDALQHLGLNVTPGSCSEDLYLLKVLPEVSSPYSPVGIICELSISVELIDCSTGRRLTLSKITDPAFRGFHAREKIFAIEEMEKSVTPGVLESHLKSILSGVFPI